jgi:aminoglycoside phosphotransferase (APT) family kinase protein
MIEALSKTYRDMAAGAMGIAPDQVSILMVHRPQEEKDYADQSVYLFFNAGQSFPAAVGKVGFDPAGAHYLERERRGLMSLGDCQKIIPAASVPRLLLYREVGGRHALLQSALRGEKVSTWLTPGMRLNGRLRRFLAWAADWSAMLGRATRTGRGELVSAWTQEFSVKLDRTGRSRELLEAAARTVREGFGGSLPAVLAHGDFCGENILGDDERYGVIDWELCDELSVPAYDILDLCLWILLRTEGQIEHDPFAALERLLHGRDPLARDLRRALGRYAAAMSIRRELLPPLLTLAWAGYCLNKFRHLERDETGHFARARVAVRKILGTPAAVLSGDEDAE